MNISDPPASEDNLVRAPIAMPGPQFWMLARAALIVALTAGCLAAVAANWVSPVRAVLAVGFLLICPGLALAELLAIRDLPQRLAIATGASIALSTLLSLLLIYIGAFHVLLAVAILAAVTFTALAAAFVRALSQPGRSRAQDL